MKKIIFFLMLLFMSNNVLIFFYGVYRQINSHSYFTKVQNSLLLDSTSVLAFHEYEDGTYKEAEEKNFILFNKSVGYEIRNIDDMNAYIKVFVKKGNRTIMKDEYIVN